MILLALVMFAFVFAPLVGWAGGRSSPFVAVIPFLLFASFCVLLPQIAGGGIVLEAHRWIPSLGIEAAFQLDGLSLTFALLISGIGSAVFLYASAYLRGAPRLARFCGTPMAPNTLHIGILWSTSLGLISSFEKGNSVRLDGVSLCPGPSEVSFSRHRRRRWPRPDPSPSADRRKS